MNPVPLTNAKSFYPRVVSIYKSLYAFHHLPCYLTRALRRYDYCITFAHPFLRSFLLLLLTSLRDNVRFKYKHSILGYGQMNGQTMRGQRLSIMIRVSVSSKEQ
jgi:hypothetical protein